MKISQRKSQIIKLIVEEYIQEPYPLSSAEIQLKYFPSLCSATIRSEMSSLEELGYLDQLHISSGRVPTILAYKHYINNFINFKPLLYSEKQKISEVINFNINKMEDIIKLTAELIADLTGYTSVLVINDYCDMLIKEVKLIALSPNTLLVLIITINGVLKDSIINLNHIIDDQFLIEASEVLNSIFGEMILRNISLSSLLTDKKSERFEDLITLVFAMMSNFAYGSTKNVFVSGETRILDDPDVTIESAKKFFEVMQQKKLIAQIMKDNRVGADYFIKIGDETGLGEDYSIVSSRFVMKGKEIGNAGVIGPKRMDYSKVLSVLKYINFSFL